MYVHVLVACTHILQFTKVKKIFFLHEVMKKILCKNNLPALPYTANIWHALEVDENIVTQIFNTKILQIKVYWYIICTCILLIALYYTEGWSCADTWHVHIITFRPSSCWLRSDVNGRALDQLHSSPGHQTKVSLRAVGVRVRDLHNYPQVEMTRPVWVCVWRGRCA